MAIHLKKLSVGTETLESLRAEQALWLAKSGCLIHLTRNRPRRAAEILDGGSIYWIIKGVMAARQKIIELAEVRRTDGRIACGLVLSKDLVATEPTKMRIFQGWRYLEAKDAPSDLNVSLQNSMPVALAAELRDLGIL